MVGGVLLDIDGVLIVSWRALPGALETLDWLRDREIPYRMVTNTSSRTRREISRLLGEAGMPVADDLIATAVTSAARLLTEQYPGRRCLVVNEGDLTPDLEGVRTVGIDRAADAEVVLLGGAGPAVGYAELNTVFRLADDGVPVVALHRNTRYQTAGGPSLDMGAFIAGLQAATDFEVTVAGKPAPDFFVAALNDLGVAAADAVMVGDDVGSDVIGAQNAGITGVLVRTGKFRESDLNGDAGHPDHVIDGIGDLPDLLDGLTGQV